MKGQALTSQNSRTSELLSRRPRAATDWPFLLAMAALGASYVLLIGAMLFADALFTTPAHVQEALASPEVRYAIRLSLLSCTLTTILSLWVAVPIGYLMSRHEFPGKAILDTVLDIPIVLPPLVLGLSLLILFQTPLGQAVQRVIPVTYEVPSIILAQFSVACAFAVRTMRTTFDQIHPRQEQVALTLGCRRSRHFGGWSSPKPSAASSRPLLWPGRDPWESSDRS
jgi:molybdate transport system permease protein